MLVVVHRYGFDHRAYDQWFYINRKQINWFSMNCLFSRVDVCNAQSGGLWWQWSDKFSYQTEHRLRLWSDWAYPAIWSDFRSLSGSEQNPGQLEKNISSPERQNGHRIRQISILNLKIFRGLSEFTRPTSVHITHRVTGWVTAVTSSVTTYTARSCALKESKPQRVKASKSQRPLGFLTPHSWLASQRSCMYPVYVSYRGGNRIQKVPPAWAWSNCSRYLCFLLDTCLNHMMCFKL